jgi:hypothetical protein
MANPNEAAVMPSGAVFLPQRVYTVSPEFLDQLRAAGVADWVIEELAEHAASDQPSTSAK